LKVFVSTQPFSTVSEVPMKLLLDNGVSVQVNQHERSMTSTELAEEIGDADVLIAGVEKITEEVFQKAPNLKLISRVGVGLDGIDFDLCRKYGVRVTYTPDAPTLGVAELCVGMILDLSRKITSANNNLKNGIWDKHMGNLIYGKTIGIIGMGRIGKSLAHLLSGFNVNFLAHDIMPDIAFGRLNKIEYVSKDELLKQSDIISIHTPLTKETIDLISSKELNMMKPSAILINTARGGIVHERDLHIALQEKLIAAAALDVFDEEPYRGELVKLDNCLLTSHMGAGTIENRFDMELQATQEVIRLLMGKPLNHEIV
jgi:D-3-phosphoglycerate dehydrogenase